MIEKLSRIALWGAIVGAVTLALLPHPPSLALDRMGDKFEHMLAFGVITVLAVSAYPRFPLPRLVERLSFLGAMIEVTQSIPALHRDCDIRDWIADTAIVLAVTLIVAAVRRLKATA